MFVDPFLFSCPHFGGGLGPESRGVEWIALVNVGTHAAGRRRKKQNKKCPALQFYLSTYLSHSQPAVSIALLLAFHLPVAAGQVVVGQKVDVKGVFGNAKHFCIAGVIGRRPSPDGVTVAQSTVGEHIFQHKDKSGS